MRYQEREDAELVELAQAGWAPAFAVLVHRHAPLVRAAHAHDPEPWQATLDVFVRAMRDLPHHDPEAPVEPWLLGLGGLPAPTHPSPADPDEIDALWRELDHRWPDGHLPRRVPSYLRRGLVVVAAIAIGVGVPAALLSVPPPPVPDELLAELRAQPLAEVAPAQAEPEEAEPLPTFQFPGADVEEPPPPAPPPPPPPPPPDPEPGPDPEPDPEPDPDDGTDDTDTDDGSESCPFIDDVLDRCPEDADDDGDGTDDGTEDGDQDGTGGDEDGGTDG